MESDLEQVSRSQLWQPSDLALWQGRTDEEDGEQALRWHQVIEAWNSDCHNGLTLLGYACDQGVIQNQGRPGAAEGPDQIRRILANHAWHADLPVFDAGDIRCRGDLCQSQTALAHAVDALLNAGELPLVLGGGHDVAFGSHSGLLQHLHNHRTEARVGILNLDAHFDLRSDHIQASSGTPFFQLASRYQQQRKRFDYACLGIARSSNTHALFERARQLSVWYELDSQMRESRLEQLHQRLTQFIAPLDYLHLSIDLDVLPAAVAPGVSAPAALGTRLEVLEPLIREIASSGKLALVDIAEYNPSLDIDLRTARVAARLISEITYAYRDQAE